MNKQEHLMYFLGQLKANIEHIAANAVKIPEPVFDQVAELESFFNENIHDILFNGDAHVTVGPICKYRDY
jgi:hypothetical protein